MVGVAPLQDTQTPRHPEAGMTGCALPSLPNSSHTAQLLVELIKRYRGEGQVAFDRQPQGAANRLKLLQTEGAEFDFEAIDKPIERVVAIEFSGVPRPRTVGREEPHAGDTVAIRLAQVGESAADFVGK